jgi:chloride channel protein, CIC family
MKHRITQILKKSDIASITIIPSIAVFVGVLAGFGAVAFTHLIDGINSVAIKPLLSLATENQSWLVLLACVPPAGLLFVTWLTRRFAPEAQGHGVPEVITAIARHDGRIRPRVAFVKIFASGICIGTGGSIGREGPIVQIGSSLGSMFGQWLKLSPRYIKILVAAGAAAGISATFNAPLSGVIFASEIILGSFAVESLTPIIIASVLADVVQQHFGEHGSHSAFQQLHYEFSGAWEQLPSYFLLGLICGLAAVSFTKVLYKIEDLSEKKVHSWVTRAIICGLIVGVVGVIYPNPSPNLSPAAQSDFDKNGLPDPPLFGVGYGVVSHALHLENISKPTTRNMETTGEKNSQTVRLEISEMASTFWWLIPLAFLKPILTSTTLAGGGSGGIFAPSLFLGATTGGAFGLLLNMYIPEWSANPGVYAIMGMAAVVAGTTHGIMSAILIVYEMTDDYSIILPVMIAAGLASMISRSIDKESIYFKKLSRRGEYIARSHDMHELEHIMVRDVMIRNYPVVHHYDHLGTIISIANQNTHLESLPVMDHDGKLIGIIRTEDLHNALDSDIQPYLINAEDISLASPISLAPDENLLEALRDFGTRDIEMLPVETVKNGERKLVGLLLRTDVMKRYRQEMLRLI